MRRLAGTRPHNAKIAAKIARLLLDQIERVDVTWSGVC
jgi:hypothetical protein